MKRLVLIFAIMPVLLSGCIIDLDSEPNVVLGRVYEYEIEKVISETWRGGQLVERVVENQAWMDITVRNTGGLTARDVQVEVVLWDGPYEIRRAFINLDRIRAHSSVTTSFDTGLGFTYEYTDYEIFLHWY